MEQRTLGQLAISVVGIGCNNFGGRIDEAQTAAVVDAAIDAGINFFDTADVYGNGLSEEFLGRALGSRRDQVVIATKFGAATGAKPDNVRSSCEASLRRLGTDVIDLYQLHRPDDDTPIDDTLAALHELVEQGKVREIGCSNFDGARIDAADDVSSSKGISRFVSVQNQLSLLDRRQEDDLLAACARHGLGILPYFPLASGMLTGKYKRGEAPPEGTRLSQMPEDRQQRALDERNFDVVERLEQFATERGHTILELAMSWLACLPNMASVIAGATKPEQVRSNASAVGWKLTEEEMTEVDRLARR
ncbi:MAG TPA: aldo/keto reductase [Acidimicrobiales bacterium]|jgi:aryl-alcohol dehydrogenase-like predicted oxidoreductase|nr:aldo/keto reductase [Acidimicrobiales bacterium]